MATPYQNIFPTISDDGVPYANAAVMPAAEGSLCNLSVPPYDDPIPVKWAQAISATVVFRVLGGVSSNVTYVVMQTEINGAWVDVAWCNWTEPGGTATFYLSGGVAGANAVRQNRAAGTVPTPANSSNQFPLGGRVRFVGKSSITSTTSSSSVAPGVQSEVTVSIYFKRLGIR